MTAQIASLPDNAALRDAIRTVPMFGKSIYRDLDVAATLDYFRRRFVDHLPLAPVTAEHTIADIGCGFGWMAMALAAFTPARVIAVDADEKRVQSAALIAELLGLGGRISWRTGSVTALPLADREADAVFCIEVLEHIGRDARAFCELERVARDTLVLTTPNGAFPVVPHDTKLPFCHWLPLPARDVYARAFGRQRLQHGNLFWGPKDFRRLLPHFQRTSRFLTFESVDDFLALYPYYAPYRGGGWRKAPSKAYEAYCRTAALLGPRSYLALHSLAGTFRRVA